MPQHIELIDRVQSVMIASLTSEGLPFSSYAPFVRDEEGRIYTLLSDIAPHAKYLQTTPKASLLFIEPEEEAVSIFARKRVQFECDVTLIGRDEGIETRLKERFKESIEMLLRMADFKIYCFQMYQGGAVFGFGKAYDLKREDWRILHPRKSDGHKRP